MSSGIRHRFLVEGPCVVGDEVVLPPERSRHMVTVLRVRRGETVRVFTATGGEFLAQVEEALPRGVRLRILTEYESSAVLPVRLVLGFAPPPGQRADLLIEKATELGVGVLQPLVCERLQGFQVDAAYERAARWRRKAEEAARQCERVDVPEIRPLLSFAEFLQEAGDGLRLLGSVGAVSSLWSVLEDMQCALPPAVIMVVGPAGGFTRHEVEAAREAGFVEVSLGPTVLRVETAAICILACVLLWLSRRSSQ